EGECRRLREVRRLGDRDELVPWLRQVVRRQFVSWLWAREGRLRLPTSIEALGPVEQEVFRLHYWQGLKASDIDVRLRMQGLELRPGAIYLALDAVHRSLSDVKKWRLMSRLARRSPAESLSTGGPGGAAIEPASAGSGPEDQALRGEAERELQGALLALTPRERLLIKLRFEDGLATREVAELLGEQAPAIRRQIKRSLEGLRENLHPSLRSRTA
ncbi:MAG: sigma-70 family RNA polymerase sigma factor, partial [Acidobacteriota bacterium]